MESAFVSDETLSVQIFSNKIKLPTKCNKRTFANLITTRDKKSCPGAANKLQDEVARHNFEQTNLNFKH